ncbi:NADPH dehydrogenase [Lysinibacillus sphaericus]
MMRTGRCRRRWTRPASGRWSGLPRRRATRAGGWLRADRSARGAWLPAAPVPVAAEQSARPLWRQLRQPQPAGARGDRRRARGVAELPLWLRLSATDWVDAGGWDIGQSVELAHQVKSLGVDLVDVSSGGLLPHAKITLAPGWVPVAAQIRREAAIATGAVSLIAEQAAQIVANGDADVVLIARESLRDPYFPRRAARNDWGRRSTRRRRTSAPGRTCRAGFGRIGASGRGAAACQPFAILPSSIRCRRAIERRAVGCISSAARW